MNVTENFLYVLVDMIVAYNKLPLLLNSLLKFTKKKSETNQVLKIYFAAYRFGMIQTKVGIAAILKDFEVTLNEKNLKPIQMNSGLLPAVKGGLWLDFKKIN